jgi:putative transcriptional regulator
MSKTTYLTNQFLIAMPNLNDPNFSHTVAYLCQHNREGALGIVINRPAEIGIREILEQLHIKPLSDKVNAIQVYSGGPVQQERGFVIHTPNTRWDSTLVVSETIALTTSRDILEALAIGEGPDKILIALGYAGWGEGQLEKEIIDNAWLNTPFAEQILFDTPVDQRWNEAAGQIGIDIKRLTMPAGHA